MSRAPLRLVQVNCGAANGWSQARSLGILRAAADRADVLFGCELSNVSTDFPLDDAEWDVVHDPSSADRAGSLLAVRRSVGRVGWRVYRVGSPAMPGIRTRWLIVANVVVKDPSGAYTLKVVSGHAPPKRFWSALGPAWFASVRARDADIIAADFNRLSAFVSAATGRVARMVGIVGFALRRHFSVAARGPQGFDVGSDHPAVQLVLFANN